MKLFWVKLAHNICKVVLAIVLYIIYMHTVYVRGEDTLAGRRWGGRSIVRNTEYTELQPLLSGVHSVLRVKLVLAGEGGGCTPTPSNYIYPHQ